MATRDLISDIIFAVFCGITLLIYEFINPNMDAERDMHENGHKIRYNACKYTKWLIFIIGWYCTLRILKEIAMHIYTKYIK
jgi:hypothetical protein